jgi:hypothetical protein
MSERSKMSPRNILSKMIRASKRATQHGWNYLKNKINPKIESIKKMIIENALRALLRDESNIIIKLLEGQEITDEDYQEDQLYNRTTNIIKSISNFLINYNTFAEMIINKLIEQYGETIYNATGTRNIILQLSEIDTVKLNNKNGFLTEIEEYLYKKNNKKLNANHKTNMIKILQLIIDILKILLVLEPFPFLNKSGDKTPGTIGLNLVISILTQILVESKHSFKINNNGENVVYEWNNDTNSFTPYLNPFVHDCNQVVSLDADTEEVSSNKINVMVFLIVLLKNLVEKLVVLNRSATRIRSSLDHFERGGHNKKNRKTKKIYKTKSKRGIL